MAQRKFAQGTSRILLSPTGLKSLTTTQRRCPTTPCSTSSARSTRSPPVS
jgi:hypothetical protein